LIVAGSDPTGGAGMQADLKTLTAIGVYGAAAVTCITVQNSRGVTRVEPLSPALVREQIESVLADHQVTHIKIGMVGTGEIARAVARLLTDFPGQVIYDPVMVATTGQNLAAPSALDGIRSLLDITTVLTPNWPELAVLTASEINGVLEAQGAAKSLLQRFDRLRAVLVKGGHGGRGPEITDYLVLRTSEDIKIIPATHARLDSRNTHGTGCTLASAYAAFHCLTNDDESAFQDSVAFLQTVLVRSAAARTIKHAGGRGPLLHYR
ncbi:MAG TPA: bifunctional hydroxymethylpyrimidine kinase/phosphomethylpyrimidine kinase, partial [Desulfobacteraceae bacterium]|nr:bifunctional hydroxymethylpyrimidine kinase/phosphomethylpyrimidine kinase [Desulfobacteraceae bacterium]